MAIMASTMAASGTATAVQLLEAFGEYRAQFTHQRERHSWRGQGQSGNSLAAQIKTNGASLAARRPVYTVESGGAAGVTAANGHRTSDRRCRIRATSMSMRPAQR